MKIVSNSSPLIALAKIGKLDVLGEDVVIPKAVFDEIIESKKEYAKELYEWGENKVVEVRNRRAVEYLEMMIDKGDAETIPLAEELNVEVVLIDDLKARRIAEELMEEVDYSISRGILKEEAKAIIEDAGKLSVRE